MKPEVFASSASFNRGVSGAVCVSGPIGENEIGSLGTICVCQEPIGYSFDFFVKNLVSTFAVLLTKNTPKINIYVICTLQIFSLVYRHLFPAHLSVILGETILLTQI